MDEDKEELDYYYEQIIDGLKLLSISDSQQKLDSCLLDYVVKLFEVADTFMKVFSLLPPLVENESFSFEIIADLIEIYVLLDIYNGE